MGKQRRATPDNTVDVRGLILGELERRKMSRYDLAELAAKYGIGKASVYDFLAARSPINSIYLGHVLAILDLTLAPSKRNRKSE